MGAELGKEVLKRTTQLPDNSWLEHDLDRASLAIACDSKGFRSSIQWQTVRDKYAW